VSFEQITWRIGVFSTRLAGGKLARALATVERVFFAVASALFSSSPRSGFDSDSELDRDRSIARPRQSQTILSAEGYTESRYETRKIDLGVSISY
jgi:hypothetical protein